MKSTFEEKMRKIKRLLYMYYVDYKFTFVTQITNKIEVNLNWMVILTSVTPAMTSGLPPFPMADINPF